MSTPDPQRLAILTDLRRAAGLNLTQMARRCGLRGKQSHQTTGAWERGVYVPSERRRTQMIGYLWDDLRLRTDPAHFEEVWTMLAQEWGWAPISDEEWRSFTTVARPGAQAEPETRAPYQAPAVPPSFAGRVDESAMLHELLTTGSAQPVALVGMGGIGKSTMAAKVSLQLRDRFGDGVLWADTRVSEPLDILNSWARAYGHDYSGLSDVQSRASAMRALLADKEALIVLDDVASTTRVQPLLPGQDGCVVLVTTRSEDVAVALGCQVLRLPELALECSLDLMASLLGDERLNAERAGAEQICALLHNLPLAVEIVGQLLAARPRRRLADMAARLQDAHGRLDLGIADRDVRTSFLVSWDALDAAHRETFSHMAVFEGRSFTAEALASVLALSETTVADRLETLAARSLVSFVGQTWYRQHPLLADFAREQLGDAPDVWQRFAAYELRFAREAAVDYGLLESEWDNVMAGLEAAFALERWETVLAYVDVLAGPWLHTAQYARARTAYDRACTAAQALGNLRACAVNLSRWANICIEQGDFNAAQEKLDSGLPLAESLNDPRISGEIAHNLARILLERGAYQEAETHLKTCLKIYEEFDDSDEEALTRHQLALLAYRRGDYDRSEAFCNEVLAIHARRPAPLGAVRASRLLTDIAIERAQPEVALSMIEQATEIAQRAQLKDDLVEIQYAIAVIHRISGRYEMALDFAQQACEAATRTGKVLLRVLAFHEQSVALKLLGRYDNALLAARRCLDLVVDGEENFNHVIYLLNMGEIQEAVGANADAQAAYRRALAMAEPIDHPRTPILLERLAAIEED